MIFQNLTRRLVNAVLLRELPRPFMHDGGHCWAAPMPHLVHLADDATHPRRSTLAVHEDGIPLHPAHSPRPAIRRHGRSQYLHWEDRVLFATSDNCDPNTNGRTYTWSASPWLFRRRIARWGEDGGLPVNHQQRDASPEQLRADVEYTLKVGAGYLAAIRREFPSLKGKTVLEVGPGINDGSVLFLAAFGARPMVLDRFLAPWDPMYHPAFYALLGEELTRRYPDADTRPIAALLDAGGYAEHVVTRYAAALEENPAPADSVDVVFSNAVVEHLFDYGEAFAALHRMTRPGGIGLHQVDFRDHRDFTRPLEFLLLEDEDFAELFERCHGQFGNRHRPNVTADAFRAAGFTVESFAGNLFADAAYLQTFMPRLRTSRVSCFRNLAEEELRVVSGFFRVRKPVR